MKTGTHQPLKGMDDIPRGLRRKLQACTRRCRATATQEPGGVEGMACRAIGGLTGSVGTAQEFWRVVVIPSNETKVDARRGDDCCLVLQKESHHTLFAPSNLRLERMHECAYSGRSLSNRGLQIGSWW